MCTCALSMAGCWHVGKIGFCVGAEYEGAATPNVYVWHQFWRPPPASAVFKRPERTQTAKAWQQPATHLCPAFLVIYPGTQGTPAWAGAGLFGSFAGLH
jgi:hypothetical protein